VCRPGIDNLSYAEVACVTAPLSGRPVEASGVGTTRDRRIPAVVRRPERSERIVNPKRQTPASTVEPRRSILHDCGMQTTHKTSINTSIKSTKSVRRTAAISAGILSVVAVSVAALTGSTYASAAPTEVWQARVVCDATACLIVSPALRDSDHDGVSDSDEIAAGTDPYDPFSRPGLKVLVELASANELPSYAMTLGRFVVYPDPATMLGTLVKPNAELQGVFDTKNRESSLGKLGVRAEDANLISGNGDILSIVNAEPTPKGSRPPGAKLNYMELVAGEDPGKGNHPNGDGVILVVVDKEKGTTTEYFKDASGAVYRTVECETGTLKCKNSDDDYVNPDESGPVDPRFMIGVTSDMFGSVLAKLGSNRTPARIGGVLIDGADVAAVVARNCGSEVANSADTTDGSKESVCDGVGLYDPESGGVVLAPAPKLNDVAGPRTVQGWTPIYTNIPGVDPLGGR
jgi:hypothetical protein